MTKLRFIERAARWWSARSAFLSWPLEHLTERVRATRHERIIKAAAAARRYPIRALRYWWAYCALLDERRKRGGRIIVLDAGCSKGIFRRFVGEIEGVEWVGVDWNGDEGKLRAHGYARFVKCDLDDRLPVADESADVILFLHVIEHLPRPEFTMGELARVLRPGGLLLAGSPVAPKIVAAVRERQLRRKLAAGEIAAGAHINSMDCSRWRTLLCKSGLPIEMLTGTFLVRWSANPLENCAWWVRLNQLWGAAFPALGGEVYVMSRKPLVPQPQRVTGERALDKAPLAWRPAWALAGLAAVFAVASWLALAVPTTAPCPLKAVATEHQDGNDTFHILHHPALSNVDLSEPAAMVHTHEEIAGVHARERQRGNDPHFIIAKESLPSVQPVLAKTRMRIVRELTIEGTGFAVLSAEAYGRR